MHDEQLKVVESFARDVAAMVATALIGGKGSVTEAIRMLNGLHNEEDQEQQIVDLGIEAIRMASDKLVDKLQ